MSDTPDSAAALAFDGVDAPYVRDMQLFGDYDTIQEILRSPDFEQGAFELSGPSLLEGSVVLLHGREHFERRRLYAHLFSKDALHGYLEHDLVPMIDHVLRTRLRPGKRAGEARGDLVDLTWHMLCRVAGSVTGLDGLDDPAVLERLVGYTKAFGRGLTVEWTTGGDQDEILQAAHGAREAFVDDIFGESRRRRAELVAAHRRGGLAEEDLPRDLITVLLHHQDDDSDDDLPLREATLFLVAATQTTGQAFPQFILHLETWIGDDADRREQVLHDHDVLAHAAYESLRLFVASPVRIRRALTDVTLSSGEQVHAGQRVGLLLQAANTDPEVFGEDADQYRPTRDVGRRSQWGLAFGGGPHMCIGRPLVTGSFGGDDTADGTMVTMARRLYQHGMALDPGHPAVRDDSTFHPAYQSVPVVFAQVPEREAP